ncbi:hypothetical protein [Paenibacillus odorifer]|uniref:hypothetical protein n=1 Tax=Paenibacillus odorifer TaxID=189426 RepID=UPI00096FEECE|nr:hypothetical protein [Paenibacillus odorifer]OMD78256.1 hypothetical protein BSK50_10940 [Paenibacillus odorifer]
MSLDNVSYRELVDNERYFLSGSNIELANLYRDFIFPFVTHHQYQLNNIYSSRLYLELALNGDTLADLTGMDIYLYGCNRSGVEPDKELPYWNWVNEITILIDCAVTEAIQAVSELLEVGLLEVTIRKGFTYFIMVPQTIKRGGDYSPDRIRENKDLGGMRRG